MNTATIVQKLWNYCNVLRDAGPVFHWDSILVSGHRGFEHRYRMTRQHPLRGRIPAMRGSCSARRVVSIFYGDYPSASLRASSEAAPALSSLRGPCSARKPGLGFLPRPLDGTTVHWTVDLFPSRPCARGIRTSCSAQLTFALTPALGKCSRRERGNLMMATSYSISTANSKAF
jgi:hypothetical protein